MAEIRRLTRAESAALRKVVPDEQVRAYRRDRDEPNNYGTDADTIDRTLREQWRAALADAEQVTKRIDGQVVARTVEWRMSDAWQKYRQEHGLGYGAMAEEYDHKARYRRATAEEARMAAGALRALADRLDALADVELIRADDHKADAHMTRFVDALMGRTRT